MTVTAADYTWFKERYPLLASAYCLTLVRDLTREEVLERFGAGERSEIAGINEVVEAGYDAGRSGKVLIATAMPGPTGQWALALEPNGFLGIHDQGVRALSQGTVLVSHYMSAKGFGEFSWAEDGDVRLRFEPVFACERDGSDPDSLVDVMARLGFDIDDTDENVFGLAMEGAFALAEHLTGARLTPELLDSATYLCGLAPMPSGC